MTEGHDFYREMLPALAAARLEAERHAGVLEHVARCEECAAELAVLRTLHAHPLAVPPGLEERIRAGLNEPALPMRRRTRRLAPWGLPLAAAAVLALVWFGDPPESEPATEVVAEDTFEPLGTWPGASGDVAGAAVLSELSVEQLEQLLEEMES